MRYLLVWVLFIAVFIPVIGRTADPREMHFSPPEFHPPKAERLVLPNGTILYLLEDHELPLIILQAMFRTGGIYDTADKVGLASMTASVMRTGGTKNHSGDEVDALLDQMAALLSLGMGGSAGYASLNVLKKDFGTGLSLFADVLMYPALEQEKLTLAKNRAIELIRRKNDYPGSIASREFRKLVYGADHPIGREATIETITNIQRKDLAAFHERYYTPNNMILGITGDFVRDEMIKKINTAFSGWPQKKLSLPPVPPVPEEFIQSVNLVHKEIVQTQLRIGHLGIKKDNPDLFALSIMNDILGGGGFSSRVFKEVRTKQGLAYSAGTVMRSGNLEKGVFIAYAATKAETTHQAISTIMEEIKKMREKKVSEEELRLAKDSFLNSFIFSFSNPSQIVGRQMSLEYYGLPENFLEQYRDNVAKVTVEDVQRVARKYLHPDGMITLVVGNEKQFDQPLSTMGKVKTISLEENTGGGRKGASKKQGMKARGKK